MNLRRLAFTSAAVATLAAPALAADAGQFVVRLGRDTTSVERWERTPDRLVVNQVGRAPRVLRRRFTYDYAGGALTHLSGLVTAPGSETPVQTIEVSIAPDSLRLKIQAPTGLQSIAIAVPPGTLVVPGSSPWAGYEGEFMKLVAGKADSLRGTMYFLGAGATDWYVVRKLGRDSVSLATSHLDVFRARVDATGHLLGMRPITGTGKYGVERVTNLDLDAMAAAFAAQERAGAGLGQLSPRDTVRATNAGGATLWIDYGRPGKRGRTIFGDVVPYGEVWRTGANAATQFRTDKALDFGNGVVVPAGFYTLWSVPTAAGWKLVVNSETGQWGTAHDAAKDLYAIELQRSSLPEVVERFTIGVQPSATGGVLTFDWDRTRGSAPFTVKP
jgi:hypothetical protein